MVTGAVLVFVFTTVVLLYFKLKTWKQYKFVSQFPGPSKFPWTQMIGNVVLFRNEKDRLKNLMKAQQECGNRVGIIAGFTGSLLLFHPDDVREILSSREVNKSRLYKLIFKDVLGQSLFYAKGKEYFRRRKFGTPIFDFKRIGNYENNFNSHSRTLVDILKKNEAEKSGTEVRWILPLCALDIAIEYFSGTRLGFLINQDNEYALAGHKEIKYVYQRAWSPWLWPDVLWRLSPTGRKERTKRKILHDLFDENIQKRKNEIFFPTTEEHSNLKEQILSDKAEKLKPLDYLIREQHLGNHEISDEFIRNEGTGAVFAAHDTVGSSLIFTIFLLASNPKEQEKLHLELDEIFGNDKERDVNSTDLANLKHLECCIKESLRLYPPVPLMLRAPAKDFPLDKDTTIPHGVEILLSPWVTHRLPEFWPEPEEFRPSRFWPENSKDRHPFSYFPFAAGPRICMGHKMALAIEKTVLAHVFRNFKVELECPAESMNPIGSIVVFPKDGLKVAFQQR